MAPSTHEERMKKTRFTEEQMVTILREADEKSVPEVAKKHGVSAQTIYGWRKHFGSLEPADIKRLRQLEQENGRLKKILADRRRAWPVAPPRVRLTLRRAVDDWVRVAARRARRARRRSATHARWPVSPVRLSHDPDLP
jgi:putative transposase